MHKFVHVCKLPASTHPTMNAIMENKLGSFFNHSLLACVQEEDKEEYERPGFSTFDFWSVSQSEHTTATHKQLYEGLKGLLYITGIEQEMACDPRAQFISYSLLSV